MESGGDRHRADHSAGGVTEFSAGLSPRSGPLGIAVGPTGTCGSSSEGESALADHPGRRHQRFPATALILRVARFGRGWRFDCAAPTGAALPCKGTCGSADRQRRCSTARPAGRRTKHDRRHPDLREVASPAGRGQAANVTWLLPEAHSMAGALSQPITLRAASRPAYLPSPADLEPR